MYNSLELPGTCRSTGRNVLDFSVKKRLLVVPTRLSPVQHPDNLKTAKMLSPLMMKMPAATTTPTSGYSRCHDGTADQGPDTTAKDRGVGLVRLANASALFPPLAHLACPSCPPSRDIVGAALCCRSGPQVRQWGEMKAESTRGLGSLVLCCLRWPAGMWGHLFVSKSGRR